MKIKHQIFLGFSGFVLLMAVVEYVSVSTTQKTLHEHIGTGYEALILASTIILGYIMSISITRSLHKVAMGVDQVGKGNLAAHIEVCSNDEIGQLATAFNKMVDDLRRSTISIEVLNREITERKNAEANLMAVFNSVPMAMVLINEHTEVIRLNDAVIKHSGKDEDQLLGFQPGDIFNCVNARNDKGGCGKGDACRECLVRNAATQVLETSQPVYDVEVEMHVSDEGGNTSLWLSLSVMPVTVHGGKHAVVTFMDITERRKNEERLIETLREVERFNRLMSGREKRVIAMKQEINALLAELGREPQYQSVLDYCEKDLLSDISAEEISLRC